MIWWGLCQGTKGQFVLRFCFQCPLLFNTSHHHIISVSKDSILNVCPVCGDADSNLSYSNCSRSYTDPAKSSLCKRHESLFILFNINWSKFFRTVSHCHLDWIASCMWSGMDLAGTKCVLDYSSGRKNNKIIFQNFLKYFFDNRKSVCILLCFLRR